MDFLPKASGTRPRLACEVSPRGVIAARSADGAAPIAAVAKVDLPEGAVTPSLKPGNLADRVAVTAALRRALEQVGSKGNTRGADLTLVIPDGAVRVLLLDFDSLPSKLTEALPLVRFRLKKLVPFDADEAMVTFQAMSSGKAGVRVLAVAIPRDVLSEYETAAREAGFEPGAVLPSTLAALAAVEDAGAVLLVNANPLGVTTAIARNGIVLLHLSMDLQAAALPDLPALRAEPEDAVTVPGPAATGVSAYSDRAAAESAVQDIDGITGMAAPAAYTSGETYRPLAAMREAAPVSASPYNSPTMLAELNADRHNAILVAPTSLGTLTEDASGREIAAIAAAALGRPVEAQVVAASTPAADLGTEVAQAVSKGAAYFEDTLAIAPTTLWSAGPLGAERLRVILDSHGLTEADGLRVREVVGADAATGGISRGWMAGVAGALKG
jgi:type IV pilus assembly protein PilM